MARILVVDDDTTVRAVVVDCLRASGHDAEIAGDGATVLELVRRGGVDLVILDIMLPAMDELEALRRLRAEGLETPVVLLTARGEESDPILGLELGADDYLAKPFSPRELVLRAQAVLRRGAAETVDAGPASPTATSSSIPRAVARPSRGDRSSSPCASSTCSPTSWLIPTSCSRATSS